MKEFLQKQFLFDKKFGFMPYFWTIALLLFSIQPILQAQGWARWLIILLGLIFAILYHDSYSYSKYMDLKIIAEIIIVITLSNFDSGPQFWIYLAWQIGSMSISWKKFIQYTILLTIASIASLSYYTLKTGDFTWYESLIGLFFAVASPFAARSVQTIFKKRVQLAQGNKRLETIIRQSERGRIAKDLHDNLGQSFSLITLKAELAEKLMTKDTEKASKELQDIANTSREDLSMVRQIVADLNRQTIAEALIIEAKNLQTADIFMKSKSESISDDWPNNVQNVIAAVIKEAVTNMLRYSQATEAIFVFSETDADYLLNISDNGIGIKDRRKNSFGLHGMEQRIKSLQGALSITSIHGTNLATSIPKDINHD